jgi:hypothetical protein
VRVWDMQRGQEVARNATPRNLVSSHARAMVSGGIYRWDAGARPECRRFHIVCAVLTGICLYDACSCHEITEWKRTWQVTSLCWVPGEQTVLQGSEVRGGGLSRGMSEAPCSP